jgi:excinuclease ABC subunit C
MTKSDVRWSDLPSKSGVYFFIGAKKEVLYIGKATNLKNRVKSYFDNDIALKRSTLIEKMVCDSVKIDWVVTDSVLEAMLLEANLIRTHKPFYNTRSKDDKSFNCVVITKDEFPRILIVRGKDIDKETEDQYQYIFGPYPSGALFKDAMKIVRKLFQFYDSDFADKSAQNKLSKGKIDFNRQIGLYPDKCTKAEYARTIKHVRLFFEGKKQSIIADLENEMHRLAKQEKFEQAHIIKKKIFSLKHIQDVSLIKDESRAYADDKTIRIEAYDIAHLQGSDMVGVMTVVENGNTANSEYRKFIIKSTQTPDDTKALKEVLERRFVHTEWPIPTFIVVDGSTAQVRTAEAVLKQASQFIPVVGVVKDEHHKPVRLKGSRKIIDEYKKQILLANAESHRFAITFHRSKRKIVL